MRQYDNTDNAFVYDGERRPIVAAQQDGGLVERLTTRMRQSGLYKDAQLAEEAATALAEKDARIAELEERVHAAEFAARHGESMSEDALHAIRELLKVHDVPVAAFIDDHVGNAIAQRDEARAQLTASRAECEGLRALLAGEIEPLATLVELVADEVLGPSVEDEPDNESVGASIDGPLPMTFGHVREAQASIISLRAALSQKETGNAA